ALDQANEVGSGGEEIEVVRHGAGEDRLRGLIAGEGPRPAGADGLAHLGKRAVEHGTIEVGFAAEEVARCTATHTGGGADLGEAGAVVAALREQALRGIKDGRP